MLWYGKKKFMKNHFEMEDDIPNRVASPRVESPADKNASLIYKHLANNYPTDAPISKILAKETKFNTFNLKSFQCFD